MDSLSSEKLSTLYQSDSGLIWIGSNNGINIYDPHTARFASYRHSVPGAPYALAAGQIRAIHATDETIWIGVDSVLHQVMLGSQEIRQYRLEDSWF